MGDGYIGSGEILRLREREREKEREMMMKPWPLLTFTHRRSITIEIIY